MKQLIGYYNEQGIYIEELVEVVEKYNDESGYWQDLVYRWNQENQNHLIY